MRRYDFLGPIGLLVLVTWIAGCHLFDDPDTLDECPLNSAYPCPCDPGVNNAECNDGSQCVFFDNPQRGVCSKSCTGAADRTTCQESSWPIGTGICRLRIGTRADHCLVACQGDDDCPPGLTCLPQDDEFGQFSACYPVDAAGLTPCDRVCTKLFSCDAATTLSFTQEECIDWCETDDWANDPCWYCWLECDVNLACPEFVVCLNECGCTE